MVLKGKDSQKKKMQASPPDSPLPLLQTFFRSKNAPYAGQAFFPVLVNGRRGKEVAYEETLSPVGSCSDLRSQAFD